MTDDWGGVNPAFQKAHEEEQKAWQPKTPVQSSVVSNVVFLVPQVGRPKQTVLKRSLIEPRYWSHTVETLVEGEWRTIATATSEDQAIEVFDVLVGNDRKRTEMRIIDEEN